MENLTVAKILTGILPRLRVQSEHVEAWDNNYPYENQYKMIDNSSFIGMEMEIENVRTHTFIDPIWQETRDDSLRNGGREYISLPIPAKLAEKSLDYLFKRISLQEDSYTPRTSIHIHLNVRTLTVAQLKGLLLTYMVFEKTLFNWIGGKREENIFCVPLHSINLTDLLIEKLEDIKNINWMKYTAVNLVPILEKGSVEFRQMVGTNDVGTIIKWINFILCLKIYALKTSYTHILQRIFLLNTKSDYKEFLYDVFKNHPFISELNYKNFEKDMSFCVTNIKQSCITNTFHEKANKDFQSSIMKELKVKLRNPVDFLDDLETGVTTPRPRIPMFTRTTGNNPTLFNQEALDRLQEELTMNREIQEAQITEAIRRPRF